MSSVRAFTTASTARAADAAAAEAAPAVRAPASATPKSKHFPLRLHHMQGWKAPDSAAACGMAPGLSLLKGRGESARQPRRPAARQDTQIGRAAVRPEPATTQEAHCRQAVRLLCCCICFHQEMGVDGEKFVRNGSVPFDTHSLPWLTISCQWLTRSFFRFSVDLYSPTILQGYPPHRCSR